jgi:hypothetical protein
MTTPDSTSPLPPRLADNVLRILLGRDTAETVSGDLLEHYRESVYPLLGRFRADLWFVGQVAGFAWRATWIWAALFAAGFLGRQALDWFVPTQDFTTRSLISTYVAMSIFIALGCWRAWRTRSILASALAALIAATIAAALNITGTAVMIAIWHDPQTRSAIENSGGLGESFSLPVMAILPATLLAIAGGLLGKMGATLFRARTGPAS